MFYLLAACVLVAAIFLSMLGQGGGVLYTPIQTLFGVGFHEAATTSLFLIMVTSLSATLVYRKRQRIDWPLVMVLESATAIGAFSGGIVSDFFSPSILSWLFSATLVFAAISMMFTSGNANPRRADSRRFLVWHRRLGNTPYSVDMALALPLSVFAGTMSGLLGIGGGLLKVPLMVLVLHVPLEIAVGSSALMVGVTAAGGFTGHVIHGHWNWQTSLILAVAVFAGAQIGSRVSLGLDKKQLQTAFGYFLLAVAALMAATSI